MNKQQASSTSEPEQPQSSVSKHKWKIVGISAFVFAALCAVGVLAWRHHTDVPMDTINQSADTIVQNGVDQQGVAGGADVEQEDNKVVKPEGAVQEPVNDDEEQMPPGFWGKIKGGPSQVGWNVIERLKSVNVIVALVVIVVIAVGISLTVYFSVNGTGQDSRLLPPPPLVAPAQQHSAFDALNQAMIKMIVDSVRPLPLLFKSMPFYGQAFWILGCLASIIAIVLLLREATQWASNAKDLSIGPNVGIGFAALIAAGSMLLGSWVGGEFSLALLAGVGGQIAIGVWAAVLAFVWLVFLLIVGFRTNLSQLGDTATKFLNLLGLFLLFALLMGGFGTMGNVVGAVGAALIGFAFFIVLVMLRHKPKTDSKVCIGLFVGAIVLLLSSVSVAYFSLIYGILSFALALVGGLMYIASTVMADKLISVIDSMKPPTPPTPPSIV